MNREPFQISVTSDGDRINLTFTSPSDVVCSFSLDAVAAKMLHDALKVYLTASRDFAKKMEVQIKQPD